MNNGEIENWQCQTCHLCMDPQFIAEHVELTGHTKIIKKDAWDVAKEIIYSFSSIPNLTKHLGKEDKKID